jgi:hypothetical protein
VQMKDSPQTAKQSVVVQHTKPSHVRCDVSTSFSFCALMGPRFQAISLTALAGVLVSDRVAAALALYPSRLVMASVRSVQATGRLGNLEKGR